MTRPTRRRCECGMPPVARVALRMSARSEKANRAGQTWGAEIWLCRLHFVEWVRTEYGHDIELLHGSVAISQTERAALNYLGENPGAAAVEVAEALHTDSSHARRTLKRLASVGMVTRRRAARRFSNGGPPPYIYRVAS